MRRLLYLLFIVLLWPSAQPDAQVARHVYLSPIDGSGTDADPFRSRCLLDAGAGSVDLRPLGINRFVCAADALPSDQTGIITLGNQMNANLTAPRKGVLAAILGRAVAANRVDELIVEVLAGAVRQGRDGKIKIWLGGEQPIYQQTAWVPFRDGGMVADATNAVNNLLAPAVAWATTLATETFNCADSTALTCVHTWVEFFGTDLGITSNRAHGSGATINEARLVGALSTDDMGAEVTIVAVNNPGESRCGTITRKDTTTTRTYYTAHSAYGGAQPGHRLSKRIAGTLTLLASQSTTPAVNATVLLVSDGSSHTMFVNGVAVAGPITDTEIVGVLNGGLFYGGQAAGDSCSMDNFKLYDYPLAVQSPRRGSLLWFN